MAVQLLSSTFPLEANSNNDDDNDDENNNDNEHSNDNALFVMSRMLGRVLSWFGSSQSSPSIITLALLLYLNKSGNF